MPSDHLDRDKKHASGAHGSDDAGQRARSSDDVRRFFIENALYWIEDCRVDALRLDAVHAIFDRSAYPFLQELADAIHEKAIELGREVNVIAESDLNDARLVSPQSAGGMGLDAQWSDDLHHCLHTLLTGIRWAIMPISANFANW